MSLAIVREEAIPSSSSAFQAVAALRDDLATAGASTGAAQVGYLPAGTGAVATTVQAFLRKRVTVEGLGADPLGLASSNTAFDNAAAEVVAQGGGDLHVGPGEFLLLNWVQPAGVRLVGAGRGRTKLKKNGGGAGTHIIRAAGTLGATQALTGNVAAGALSVPVATSAAFAINAWALVREATYVSGASGRKQQIVRVTGLTGTSVSFAMPLLEAYTTAASAEVLPLSGVTDAGLFALALEGVNSSTGGGGVQVQYGIGFQVEDVHNRWSSDQAALKFSTCYDSHMHNVSCRDGLNQAAAGYGYGIEFDESVMMSSVTGAYTENMRENLFTNRTALCRFAESRMVGNYDSGVNTHGAFVRHCTLEDNEIIGVQVGLGVGVGFGTHGAGDTDIVVRRNKIMYAGSVGIAVNAPVGKENLRIELDGNTVFQNAVGTANTGILIQYSNTVRSRDNVVDGNNSTNVNAGFYVLNCTDTTFDDEGVRNLANGYGFRYESCTDLSANNVSVFNVSSDNFRGTGTNVRVFVNGKRVDDANETIGTGAAHTGRPQAGRAALVFAGVSTVTLAVTFPAAYPTGVVPVVNATAENSLGVWRGALISTPTNTGFSITLTDDGATNRTGTAYVNWVALG